MVLSMYQKAVLVSELQEMKRLKQSPHNYKFSHNWVYKHKMQRMWSMQGFLLAPQSFRHWSSPARAALQSPKAGINPDSLSTCTHLSQQTHPSWPSAASPHKTFCTLGFFLLALTNSPCQNQLWPANLPSAQWTEVMGTWGWTDPTELGQDPTHHYWGPPKWTPQLGPVPPLSSCAFTALLSGSRSSHH